MMGDFGGYGWGMGAFGWVFMILLWGMVIVGIVAIVRWLTGNQSGRQPPEDKSALDILKERYARGDIDKKEFEEKRRDLE